MTATPGLEDLEGDALTELVSIGANRAAVALRKMVGAQVVLSVPSIEIILPGSAAALLQEGEKLIAACQDFQGDFAGRAMLIFSQDAGAALIEAIAGDTLKPEELEEMADEVLAETGNIVLNGCLSSMANMLQHQLALSLPTILRGNADQLFRSWMTGTGEGMVLFIFVNFTMKGRSIRGYIALLMDLQSLAALRRLVESFITRSLAPGGGAAGRHDGTV